MMNEYWLAAPEIFLATAICVVLLVDVFLRQEQRGLTYLLSMLALVGVALVSMASMIQEPAVAFSGSFISDPAGGVLKLVAYIVVALVFVYSRNYLEEHDLFKGEFFVLSLFGLLGIMVMISANSMLIMYLGLELLSLSLYALVAFNRDSAIAAESAMKYFVLGAIASGTLLYGISLLYGVTGTLEFSVIAASLTGDAGLALPAVLGLVFVVVGVAFKFGAVPFHMWLPDVYQGAPTPVTLFIGSAPKIAAFALTWRVLTEALAPMGVSWQGMLIVLCVLSLFLGNIVAIAQTNLKRMLAYSTISHVGFILMGFIAGSEAGLEAAMFYTLTYALMAAAAFGMIIVLSRRGFEAERLEDFKGLNQRSPWFALMMLLIMLSMAGVPPLVGFFAKLAVLSALVEAGLVWLAILGVVLAVVGAFYYLRVIWYMYFAEPLDQAPLSSAVDLKLAISVNSLALVALGIFPGYLLNLCGLVL
jgi:NADH-quinone oxidoreductase subunit N